MERARFMAASADSSYAVILDPGKALFQAFVLKRSCTPTEETAMYDINKIITHESMMRTDPEGNLFELDHWSPRVAQRRAEEEGITLTDEHWAVVFCLRERYRVQGPARSARELVREMEREFEAEGGRRYLYELFPHGPIVQASRIAGVPLPPGTIDPSFGSVH
jgi:tRNA 2-thiouridine synthesizing protein E